MDSNHERVTPLTVFKTSGGGLDLQEFCHSFASPFASSSSGRPRATPGLWVPWVDDECSLNVPLRARPPGIRTALPGIAGIGRDRLRLSTMFRPKGVAMSENVLVIRFAEPSKAYQALSVLKECDAEGRIGLESAAVVERMPAGELASGRAPTTSVSSARRAAR